MRFVLKKGYGNNQFYYRNKDVTSGSQYTRDIFGELKKPIEQNRLKEQLSYFIENPSIPADLSDFHDSRKNEIQAAIFSVQEELNRPGMDDKARKRIAKKVKSFTDTLFNPLNTRTPNFDENAVLQHNLMTLQNEIEIFQAIRPEEQKQIAKFVLDTLEKDAANQPSFDDIPGLRENRKLQGIMFDFMMLTNIVEASPPKTAHLEFYKRQGILDVSTGAIEKQKAIDEKWSPSGRTLGLDSVMRDRLRRFIEEDPEFSNFNNLDDVFSVDEYPARERPGGTRMGRDYGASHQSEPLSPGPSSPELGTLSMSPGPSTSAAYYESDLVDSDHAKSEIIELFSSVDNLGRDSDTEISATEDDTEVAAKKAKLEADGEYMKEKAEEALTKSCEKRESICSVRNKDKIVLDEDSVELKEDKLNFEFYEPHNKDVKYTVSTEIDQRRLSSLKYIGEKEKYSKNSGKDRGIRGKIGTALGIHGLVMSVFGAINAFEQGDTVSGAITVAQTLHTLHSFGSVKKLSDFATKIGKKALQKAVIHGAEKLGLTEAAERATTKLARLAESDAALLLGDIPFVGLAFDAYFIASDIQDLTTANFSDAGEVALDVVHLALDIGATVANMLVDTLGPEFEPVVWALSLLRISVDDFYIDIKEELSKANSAGEKLLGFLKGIAEGFVDFVTGGLLIGIRQLNERKKKDQELLEKLANPKLYFKLGGTDCKGAAGTIDFTEGDLSGQGGEINFKLNDDDSFNVELTGVPAEGGEKKTISKKFQCSGLRDIVLGVGETQDAVWTKQKAKLWAVITVKTQDVIDHFKDNNGSLYGSYTGNSKNNAFYALQGNFSKGLADECKDPDATRAIDLRISNYLYLLNGMAGNDSFLLGSQRSHVTGGSGHDLYYLGTHGGDTVIDNFAFDKLSDTLWLNVSHEHVVCGREDFDLLIAYCDTHMVRVKEWFFPVQYEFRRHLVLLTRDGIQLQVKNMGVVNDAIHKVDCVPVSIDRSKSSVAQRLDLTEEQYKEVVTVTGSKADDVIIGNDKDNYINAGPGSNQITGGEGVDTYILRTELKSQKREIKGQKFAGDCSIIKNYANDLSQDKILLPIKYDEIDLTATKQQSERKTRMVPGPSKVAKVSNLPQMDLKISKISNGDGAKDDSATCILIQNWFKGKNYQHLTFVTEDYVVFHVKGTQQDIKRKPSMLDYSMSATGITCDLKGKKVVQNLKGVQTVLDSYLPDIIYGNDAPNFISTHGNDYLQGNGGSDIYKIKGNCKNSVINNIDQSKERDVIMIEQDFDDISTALETTNKSLELRAEGFGTVVTFLRWFENETYRHATVRTSDGVTALLPNRISEMSSMNNKLKATEISLDQEDCNNGLKTYDLNENKFHGVLRFTAKSDLCSYKVIGNDQNNYLDPGPENPHKYQYLEGGKGSDTYVIGSNYGEFNEINNYAEDDKIDILLLNVAYKHIKVDIKDDDDLILWSKSKHNKVSVTLKGFLHGKEYQHMLLQSADKVLFRLLPHYPHTKPVIVDYSHTKHSHIVSMTKRFPGAGIFYGSKSQTNVIYGSDSSTKLSGGYKTDTIEGGILGETIEGFDGNDILSGQSGNDVIYGGDGNDVIDGNAGNDVIYGGDGADRINGGDGIDTLIFKGDSVRANGVRVNLKDGYGRGSDAEGDRYTSFEVVVGSEFDDIIEGSDSNNIMSGNSGNDTIITYSGYDIIVGGQGEDLYNLTTASGWKIINNYATDKKADILKLGKVIQKPCYYSFKNDLYAHFELTYKKNVDLVIKQWYRGNVFQHISFKYTDNNDQTQHTHLAYFKKKMPKVPVDQSVKLFRKEARIMVKDHGSDFVEVKLINSLRKISIDLYTIFLNYISEGQEYRQIDISTKTNPGTTIELKEIAAGVVTSISMSLHRCSQVLAMTLPVTQRTIPNPPTDLAVTHVSEVSITIKWKLPSIRTDPNRKFYKFHCRAVKTSHDHHESVLAKETVTNENTTHCLLDGLKHDTEYLVDIESIAGGETSKSAFIIVQTNRFCPGLEEPQNGAIIDSQSTNGMEMATLKCEFGYELTVVDTKNAIISKTWLIKPNVFCNSTRACVKWISRACTQTVKCLRKSCDQSILAQHHLEPSGQRSSEFLHEDNVPVTCIDGFLFGKDQSPDTTAQISCWNGKWKKIPACNRYKNCAVNTIHHGSIVIDGKVVDDKGKHYVQVNHGLTATYKCNHGYTLRGVDQVKCNDGSQVVKLRTPDPTHCCIINCPSLADPENGKAILYPSRSPVHGSRYTFACNPTYFLAGPGTKTCDAGKWLPSETPNCWPKPCNKHPCQNNGACHNIGNWLYSCTCGQNWQGYTCNLRKIVRTTLAQEILDSLAENGGTSNKRYADILISYLLKRYDSYFWLVNSYNPVRGLGPHKVDGVDGAYIKYFRTHRRNLVVCWARRSSAGWPRNMTATQETFEKRLRGKGCDTVLIYSKMKEIAKDLGLPLKMAHIVGWGNGFRGYLYQGNAESGKFAFTMNYYCRSDMRTSISVAFGQG